MLLAGIFLLGYLLITRKIPVARQSYIATRFRGFAHCHPLDFLLRHRHLECVGDFGDVLYGCIFCVDPRTHFYNRKMLWYEILFGLIIIACLCVIMNVEVKYLEGMVVPCFLFSWVWFSPSSTASSPTGTTLRSLVCMSFCRFFFVSLYLLYDGRFNAGFFEISRKDWIYLFYPFVGLYGIRIYGFGGRDAQIVSVYRHAYHQS
jgi:hypothetical protein